LSSHSQLPWLTEFTIIIRTKSNNFFGNNSGKSEPIGTQFYQQTWGHVARSPANFWRSPPNRRKMAVIAACYVQWRLCTNSNLGWPWLASVILTHNQRKILKRQCLGDYCRYSDVIVHSHAARNALRGRWHMWLWPSLKKGQNALTYFSVFRFQYADDFT